MTCVGLFWFLFVVSFGVGGYWVGSRIGALSGVIGAVLGLAAGFGVIVCIWRLLELLDKWRPPRPSCRNGVCRFDDYDLIRLTDQGGVFRCGCGDEYQRAGRRFMLLHPDGTVEPYMVKPGTLRRWEPDTA